MNEPLNVLSVQSHVAYGHVGNSSAVFTMQRLGVEAWPIHTVQFSNHTGYGDWRGRVYDGDSIDEIVDGIGDRGVLGSCDGVLSGYLGSADIGHAVLGAVTQVRAANPTPSTAATRCSAMWGEESSCVRASPSSSPSTPCGPLTCSRPTTSSSTSSPAGPRGRSAR
jgi:pyridoxal kinase